MKRSISSLVLSVPVALASCAVFLFGVPAANAAAPVSNTPPAAGIVTVCPGVSYNSLTDVNGVPPDEGPDSYFGRAYEVQVRPSQHGKIGFLQAGP
jgi:hypothetical protein